ncbi:MAG: ATP-binding protein [Candidatus Scalinduaceae bacterium]
MFKIRDKILVTFLSVVIIPLIITGTFFGIFTTKYLGQDKIVDFQKSTKHKADKSIHFMRSIENDIISLSNNVFLLNLIEATKNKNSKQIKRYKYEVEMLFKTFSESRVIYDSMSYINESGHEIVRTKLEKEHAYIIPPERLQDKNLMSYFKGALGMKKGDVYVSKLDLNSEDSEIVEGHKPILRYATPVFDKEKQNRGIIVLNIKTDFILKNILAYEYLRGADSYLLDKEGYYFLYPDTTRHWSGWSSLDTGKNLKDDFPPQISSIFLSGQSGTILVDKHFFSFTPIRFDPLDNERYWILLESLQKSVVYSPIYTFYLVLGVLALLIITGIVVSAFVFSRKLTNPLNKLVKGVTTIAEIDSDDLDYHINVTSNDEIAFLTFSFNKMIYKLGMAKKRLRDYANNLEKKVKGKTKEVHEKAKELEKVNNELKEFIYIVSHDLKEPLFAIEGFTTRLSKIYGNVFDEKGKRYIDRLKANIDKMSLKINEIMEVMRVGRVIYDFRNNDSGVIIEDVVRTLESKIKDRNINLSIQKKLPTVYCDDERMKDVFLNLLTNAVKFMDNDNQNFIKVGCDRNNGYYKFFVEDTGIGIQAEYQKQIFKIFRRLMDVEAEGTGVGLAIAKKIVELHKGKIWVESPVKEGRGSRFCFTIPT